MIGVLMCFGSVKGCRSRFFRVSLTTQGATLYMVCRSKERAEAARDEIVAAAAGHRSGGSNLARGLLFWSVQTEVELVY